ncbi:MAG: P-type conjugative transfer protein VirB9 [Phenylobacterium sp.]|uniref:P-type conjugative transfer protein VirB9 n=1 Tax=Phenylobacterium sp. TaxID=1871053 RepID=UPI00271E3F74|nr:P-type conjugative transfer protein VirB9 [Phenylobacterium sp.]MDO8912172.1 P-type conjugative transfer protein VirB9 [Phenylobacterium sp.]
MRTPLVILAAATLAVATPVFALDTPKSGPSDPRIKVVDYDPWAVVKITGVFRTATQILLGPDEAILHVAVGDATGWDVAAEKNILFVKPKAARAPTNLIVTTSRGTETRNYTFELSTRAGSSARTTPDTVFGLRFRYPQDEKAAAASALTAQAAALERRIVELKLDRAVVEGRRNLNYGVQGATALQPSEVSDNGRFTVMRFPANQQVPAIYQVESSGTESLIPFDVRGEFVVVHAVVRQLRLRRGRDVLCIYNQAFEPYGVNPGTGTAAPDVQRTDQGASKP